MKSLIVTKPVIASSFNIPKKFKKRLNKIDKLHKTVNEEQKIKFNKIGKFLKNFTLEETDKLKNELKVEKVEKEQKEEK